MTLNAIYYPHTAVREEKFLKHSLLYWDEIEYISPFPNFNHLPRYPGADLKALAAFVKPRVPTEKEKKKAHGEIMKLIEGDLPAWLKVDRGVVDAAEHEAYFMFRDKLLPETWKELEKRGIVHFKKHGHLDDYVSHTYLGLTLMAILARCCAGSLKHTITDQSDAYASFLKHLEFLSGSDGTSPLDPASRATFERWLGVLRTKDPQTKDAERRSLVSITLDVIDAGALSVKTLIRMRTDKTAFAADLRNNYAKAIEEYVEKLSAPNLDETDAGSLREEFRKVMKRDRDKLYEELAPVAKKTLLSKEVAIAITAPLVGAAVLQSSGIGTLTGGAFAVRALGELYTTYQSNRDAVFARHPMAFVYSAKKFRLY